MLALGKKLSSSSEEDEEHGTLGRQQPTATHFLLTSVLLFFLSDVTAQVLSQHNMVTSQDRSPQCWNLFVHI